MDKLKTRNTYWVIQQEHVIKDEVFWETSKCGISPPTIAAFDTTEDAQRVLERWATNTKSSYRIKKCYLMEA